MKVSLAGTNVELTPLLEALDGKPGSALLSPEPIAAAYARISRSSLTVEELREEARTNVERARRSNRSIVFDMGHASIAEHAVFNIDIEDISRLAIESLQQSRLASYTERSQRYVLLGKDYLVPDELAADSACREVFEATVGRLFTGYNELFVALRKHHQKVSAPATKSAQRAIENRSKEDARYVLPLATTGQLGMTINARTLESMVRRMKGSRLAEVRKLGLTLEEAVQEIVPSLVRYTEPTASDELLYQHCILDAKGWSKLPSIPRTVGSERVFLRHVTQGAEVLLRHLLAATVSGDPYGSGGDNSEAELADWIGAFYSRATPHTPAPRLFEAVDLIFELVCSASCFGQLKRHRMATVLPSPYSPGLGVVVPPAVREAGLEEQFLAVVAAAEEGFCELSKREVGGREYLLTNCHSRRVWIKMNLRELYHFSRLRMDSHSQWEIRLLANRMAEMARDALPDAAAFLGGKDTFGQP
jgi:flavin-dependent thymidylate synthase